MAWRKLPPRLRGRVPRVNVVAALPAVVVTVLLGVVWVVAPVVLVVLLAANEHYVLAGLLAVVALWWLYRTVREPIIPGLLLAAPASVRSVIQQQRGFVDTEDLECGRLVGLAVWRRLTTDERAVLEVLARQSDDLPELAQQIEQCEVIAECICGCASVRLFSTGPSVPHGEGSDRAVTAVGSDSTGPVLDVTLHLDLGRIRELEVTANGRHDGTAQTLPAADNVQPTGVWPTQP